MLAIISARLGGFHINIEEAELYQAAPYGFFQNVRLDGTSRIINSRWPRLMAGIHPPHSGKHCGDAIDLGNQAIDQN